jgi:hypothetical protein
LRPDRRGPDHVLPPDLFLWFFNQLTVWSLFLLIILLYSPNKSNYLHVYFNEINRCEFNSVIVWWMIWCPIYNMGYEFSHFFLLIDIFHMIIRKRHKNTITIIMKNWGQIDWGRNDSKFSKKVSNVLITHQNWKQDSSVPRHFGTHWKRQFGTKKVRYQDKSVKTIKIHTQ